MQRYCRAGLLAVLLLVALTGCQFTQPEFERTAGDTGATFAAAATTLTYVHEQKIPPQYATSSFANFESTLAGLDQQLPGQQGAPDRKLLQSLLSLYREAMKIVQQPCLEATCDWRTQVQTLKAASQAFLKAGGE